MNAEDSTLRKIVSHPAGPDGEIQGIKQRLADQLEAEGKDASAVQKQLKDLGVLSSAGHGFMNELLNPSPTERLGGGEGGIADVQQHQWFQKGKFNWGSAEGKIDNPLLPWINKRLPGIQDAQALESRPFNGDQGQFESF